MAKKNKKIRISYKDCVEDKGYFIIRVKNVTDINRKLFDFHIINVIKDVINEYKSMVKSYHITNIHTFETEKNGEHIYKCYLSI